MNRRQFTQRLAALFAAPALPAPTIASSSATSATAGAIPAGALHWARYLQDLHATCTPSMLKSLLSLSDHAAQSLHRQLVTQGVIGQTGAVAQGVRASTSGGSRPVLRTRTETEGAQMAQIRPAEPGDVPELAEIWYQGWHEAHAAHIPGKLTAERSN